MSLWRHAPEVWAVVCRCVLLNIVVAVLLDELFLKMAAKREADTRAAAQEQCDAHCLDPLLQV